MEYTLIIKTRNRSMWIKKFLLSLRIFDYKYPLIIIDDSNETELESTKLLISNKWPFEINLVQGIDREGKERSIRVYKSTFQAISMVETEFFSILGDDDFIFPSFIHEGIKFLSKNQEYSSYIGPEIGLSYSANLKPYSSKIKVSQSCEFDDPMDRLMHYQKYPTLPFYGVCRIQNFKNSSIGDLKTTNIFNRSIGTLRFLDEEFQLASICYISGKIKYESRTLQGVRGLHMSLDRLGTLVNNDKESSYNMGPLIDFLNFDSRIVLAETINPIVKLLSNCGTAYSEEESIENVTLIVWNLLTKYRRHPRVKTKKAYAHELLDKVLNIFYILNFNIKYFQEIKHLKSMHIKKYLTISI